jgi:GDP-D-mannose 3',5'-epimerase
MCRHFQEDYGLATRVGRYHNVFGPHTAYDGGREKAPAALARKVAQAKLKGRHEIEIWGDGEQTRSFMYIDDCVEGLLRLMASEYRHPLNLGTDQLVTINELVDMVSAIADKRLTKVHLLDKPQGVRGRNSNNDRLRTTLGWEPSIKLEQGLAITYRWIEGELRKRGRVQREMSKAATV